MIRHIWLANKSIGKGDQIREDRENFSKVRSDTILIVGMLDSPHFQTWLTGVREEFPNRRLILFPSDRPGLTKDKAQKLVGEHKNLKVFKLLPHWKLNFYAFAVLDKLFGLTWRAYFLGKQIIFFKPSVLHFHEMQHGAYIMNLLVGYKKIPTNTKKVISTWGSDLTLFSWSDSHQANLRSCMHWANIITAEKKSEEIDARRLGYSGEFRAPVYIHLGVPRNLPQIDLPPSKRKRILIKGYQGWAGRGLNALEVLTRNKALLHGFEVLVFSSDESVRIQIDKMRNLHLINIRAFSASHTEMQEYFASSRLAIGLSESDGLPASFVEALSAGCFTIQSKNSSAVEFITDGVTGFLVDPWDLDSIQNALEESLTNDLLVDNSVSLNRQTLFKKYNRETGIEKLRNLYF